MILSKEILNCGLLVLWILPTTDQSGIALTTLDHVAFEISLEQYPTERQRLQQFEVELTERIWQGAYAWLRARSLFFDDPDGNTIELIAHDPSPADAMTSG